MSNEKMGAAMTTSATASRKIDGVSAIGLFDVFEVECYSAEGELKWVDTVHNNVTDEGIEYAMSVLFYSGTQYAENGGVTGWNIGLIDATPTPNFTDTAAGLPTIMSVTEYAEYDEAGRQVLDLAAAGSSSGGTVTNSNSTAASFTISSPGNNVGGCFIVAGTNAGTKDNTVTGVLYGAGAFTGGDKTVDVGDTLNVTVNVTAANG